LKFEFFIVRKIAYRFQKGFSSFAVKIALCAVALSTATMVIATSLINGFQKEIKEKIFGFWAHANILPFSLTRSYEEKAIYKNLPFYVNPVQIPEVKHIQVTAYKGGLMKTKNGIDGIVLKGVGSDFNFQAFKKYLRKGEFFNPDSQVAYKQIIVSKNTAQRLDLKLKDKVVVNFMGKQIKSRSFRVCGMYETGLEELDRQFALVSLPVIQDLNGWGRDSVGSFEVFFREENLFRPRAADYFLILFGSLLSEEKFLQLSREPLEDIADKIYYDIAESGLDVQTIKYQNPGLFDWLELQTMNEIIILMLMIIVAAINMITALLIIILERTNMIGILKALGTSNRSIRKIFLYYAVLILGGGVLAGNAVGILLCVLQHQFGWVTLPQESYYLSKAPIDLNLGWIAWLNLATLLVCSCLLILPTGIIGNISPVKTIRFQ
jgi:lipoprotein-releasing system permease protein